MNNYFVKTNRTFTTVRKYGWILTVLIALVGSFWLPKLGLLVGLIMLSLTISGFFNGRYWCGNVCPHGSLFDKVIMPISLNKTIPKFLKSKPFIITFFIFFMANFTRKLLRVLQAWGTYTFLDKLGLLFSKTYLVVLIVGGLLAVFVNPRVWCQFCPMGSLQKLSYKLGSALGVTKHTETRVTISDKDKCRSCGMCSKVCPFQLTPHLEFSTNNQFDNTNCIKCSTCVKNCPLDILSLDTLKNTVLLQDLAEQK